ncbi:helix-turn-helix domain-containing protein [Brotaphodocola sp.]|uniref:helix-turn-helix domain-containing protein n=1 Tax=Brotaphodocola sp. TaxID=3073577 RepID=UPI003D7EA219
MAVSYKKLFKLLIDRDMRKKDFREITGVSPNTVSKLKNGENVTMDVIERICRGMNCSVDDICEFLPDTEKVEEKNMSRAGQEENL